jgi:uncharacterized protein YjeT (DUF2065 family)
MNWSDLAAAFALYLVLEGIMPFMSPQGLKRAMLAFASLGDRQLRVAGLTSMITGLVILYLVRG